MTNKKQQEKPKLSSKFRSPAMSECEYSAAKLRELREQAGLTQTEFGARTGIPQTEVSRYERGMHSMTMDRFFDLCHRAGYEMDISFRPKT
jgi:transcriptional regulator with XRE-family HTH domain